MQKRKQSSPLKQSSKAKVRILSLLDNNCNIAPCKGIQDSLELWTPGIGFRIPGFGFRIPGIGFRIPGIGFRIPVLDSGFQVLDYGFQGLDSGFHGLDSGFFVSDTWIADSNLSRDFGFLELYSGFHKQKFLRFRNTDSLTQGDYQLPRETSLI